MRPPMNQLLLFNKPFNVLSQFTDENNRATLKDFLNDFPVFYAAGRLDYDSEGLLLLTNNGIIQHHISDPKHQQFKTYWVQVEGNISQEAIQQLASGVTLKDGITLPATAEIMSEPNIWPRCPPIRERKNIPTSWVSLRICEGKNRQVRRMTAAVGFPTLRLIRVAIGEWSIGDLQPGQFTLLNIASPPSQIISTKPKTTLRHTSGSTNKKPRT